MLRKLQIQQEEDLQCVVEVAAQMFSDGVTNWGRVVTLIAFGAFVAKHLKSIQQEQSVSSLAGIITDALVNSKREWLESQGGWVSHHSWDSGAFPDIPAFSCSRGGGQCWLAVARGVCGLAEVV
nr:induced myeloid leukemia cell differentiation protein Mcl-1 homolog [Zonotrichia albicollis]